MGRGSCLLLVKRASEKEAGAWADSLLMATCKSLAPSCLSPLLRCSAKDALPSTSSYSSVQVIPVLLCQFQDSFLQQAFPDYPSLTLLSDHMLCFTHRT